MKKWLAKILAHWLNGAIDDEPGFVRVCVLMVREEAVHELEALRVRAGAVDYADLMQKALVSYEDTLNAADRALPSPFVN